SGWSVIERDGMRQLQRVFEFPDFARALAFTDRVGALAEAQGHHPALLTEWGRVTARWRTHAIRGLHRNDFIMAGQTDRALGTRAAPESRPQVNTAVGVTSITTESDSSMAASVAYCGYFR